MRKKVKRILALLLAIGLAVSVTSGIALSTSAETDAAQVSQEEPVESEPAAASEEPAAEPAQEEQEGSEEADPEPAAEEEKQGEAEEPTSTGEALDQTVTVGSGDKTVKVRTTAEAGVLPEGATLVVKQLEKDDSQYEDAVDQLEANEITYDGLLALDVGFEVNGQKVEPTGSVDVKFELGAGLLPEDADTDSLAVQHLPDSSKVETVADAGNAAEGTVTVQEQKVNADFTVDCFSTFTISWYVRSGYSYKTLFELTVKYVDVNGKEINPSASNVELSNNTTINFFTTYGKSINGYDWIGAYYGEYAPGGTNQTITDLATSSSTERVWIGLRFQYVTTYKIAFTNNTRPVAELTNTTDAGDTKTATLTLVYQKDTTGDTGGTIGDVTLPEPGHEKKAIRKEDGTYDLSLSVSGSIGSQTEKQKVDVLLIIDKSNSMAGDNWTNTKSAADNLIDAVAGNGALDSKFNVVTFYGSGSGQLSSEASNDTKGWTDASTAKSSIPSKITSNRNDGGTNYQAGIRLAKQQLNLARPGAQTVVIFLSDGLPTYRLSNPQGDGYGNGKRDPNFNNINAAVAEIRGMYTNQFYAIGVGSDFKNDGNSTQETVGKTNLKKLCSAVHTAKTPQVFTTSDASDLNKIFEDITASITSLVCTEVSISDTLSTNAQVVKKTNGTPSDLIITVTNAERTIVSGSGSVTVPATELNPEDSQRTITASYVNNNTEIQLNFPTTYKLEADYTYTVTANIEPTDAAYAAYTGTYPNKPDAGTGTHADAKEKGFYCNSTATLSYNNGKEPKTATYAKPVIRLNKCNVTLKKVVAGNMGDTNKGFDFAVTGGTVSGSTDGKTTLKDKDTVTITAKVGAEVTITETDYSSDGYRTTASSKKNNSDTEIGTYSGRTYTFTMGSTMTEDTEITFTNTKTVIPPNGLNHNITPYIIMVVLAAGAGVYFVVRRRPRGRHCK